MGTNRSGSLRASEVLLQGLAWVVPANRREDWLREWRAELWHEADRLARAGVPFTTATLRLFGRSLGCITDAAAMRRFHPVPVEEDLASAVRVVFSSPAAAGMATFMVGVSVAADTMLLTLSRFVYAIPPRYDGLRAIILLLTALLALLLPLAACRAAVSAVGWSEAGRREEAMRRAMGIPEPRLRRLRALQGMLVGCIGSAAGALFAAKVVDNVRLGLLSSGDVHAATRLVTGPTAYEIALPVAIGITLLLPFSMGWRRRQPAGAVWSA